MADWNEIKRLAADFQKIQLSSTTQRLSERNCIEIISWLTQQKLIDLIFTSDGKEYMTPAHLVQDIKNELYVSGGRVNLVELSKNIGVDLAHINTHINEVLRSNKEIHSVLGQLIDNNYITQIAGEINEKLQQQGQINVSDLTIHYDLPAEFLQQQVLEKYLGKTIQGKQDKSDPRVFFTESFIARTKAKIRGAVCGLTKPTPVSVILTSIDISEKLFFTLFDQVLLYGTFTSRLPGAQYIPNVYARTQNEWINNFYKQNGYLEFDALIRLGITDYKTYLKKQFANEQILMLNSCMVSTRIIERTEVDIDECIASKSYVDLQNNTPSVFNDKDFELLLNYILNNQKQQQVIILENYVVSKAFIESLSKNCEILLNEKAKTAVESGQYQQYQTEIQVSLHKTQKHEVNVDESRVDKREERRKKAAGGKTGGGTQGRETKTKSTKKLYRNISKHTDDDYYENSEKKTLEIITNEDIKNVIESKLEEEGLDDLINPIVSYLLPLLNEKSLEIAASLYKNTVSDRTANRRQTHNEVQNKINMLLGDVRLFEKGIKLMPNDVQQALYKYLLKTICTDIVNELLNYTGNEEGHNTTVDNYTNEQRLKFISELPVGYRNSFQTIVKSLSAANVDDFVNSIEDALIACSMILKKIDKKKDRTLVLNHKHTLLEQLNNCDDPAVALLLAVLAIFTTATQNILHASGRHVSSILTFLNQYLSKEQALELRTFYDLVTVMLGGGIEGDVAKEQLKDKMSIIKNIANEYKKPGTEKSVV